jgi:hypothetical protein
MKGEYEKAIADCTNAIKLDPKDAYAYSTRGSSLAAKGEKLPKVSLTLRKQFGSIRKMPVHITIAPRPIR